MNLRHATVADADAIAGLIAGFHREITGHPDGVGAEPYVAAVSVEAVRGYLASARYAYTVAERDGEVRGFIALRDGGHVFHLFVARDAQGQGLARRLWQHARAQALPAGAPAAFTVNASLNAVPVYRAFGFEATGDVTSVHGISFLPMRLDAVTG
jgi:GNAT superfamily N-acetyltransferase